MRASLRSALVLATAGALGFAAGSYIDRGASEQSSLLTIPSFTPVDADSSLPSAAATPGLPQVPGTLRDIMRLRGDFAQSTALHVLAAGADRKGIERLLEEAASIEQPSERRAASSILYARYAELDPKAAIEHIMRRDGYLEPGLLYGVFHTWGRSDLEGALAYLATLDPRSRMAGGSAILRARDDLPPQERERIAAQLDLDVSVSDPSALNVRTPESAAHSWREALATEDYESRLGKLQSLAYKWAKRDPQAALRAAESLRDRSLRAQVIGQVLYAWGESDPRAAADWALARPPSPERMQLVSSALNVLVMKDPIVAMGMTENLPNQERQQVLPSMLMNWAIVDARSAAAWAENLDGAQWRRTALASVAGPYASRRPDEALRWAASLPADDSQLVMSAVVGQIASSDPVRASGLLSQIDSGPQRDNATLAIAQSWAQRDPQAALAWVAKLPASEMTPAMYSSIFQQWAAYDMDGASGQLSQIDDPGTRNTAVIGMLGNPYLESDAAHRLYQRVEGAEARRQAAGQIYYNLRESDPRAAERYRVEAGLPEDAGEQVTTFFVN